MTYSAEGPPTIELPAPVVDAKPAQSDALRGSPISQDTQETGGAPNQNQPQPSQSEIKDFVEELKNLKDSYQNLYNVPPSPKPLPPPPPPPLIGFPPDPAFEQELGIKFMSTQKWRETYRRKTYDCYKPVLTACFETATSMPSETPEENVELPSEAVSFGTIPYRLVINSPYIMRNLSTVTGHRFGTSAAVMIRPFKYLIKYESDIRSLIRKAKEDYASRSKDPAVAEAWSKYLAALATTDRFKYNKESPPLHEICGLEPHHWTELTDLKRTNEHLDCLKTFLDRYLSVITTITSDLRGGKRLDVLFEELHQLFKPGDIVLVKDPQNPTLRQAYCIVYVTGARYNIDKDDTLMNQDTMLHISLRQSSIGRQRYLKRQDTLESYNSHIQPVNMTPLTIGCFHIDFEGQFFKPFGHVFQIREFSGSKRITDLDFYPLSLDQEAAELGDKLALRGRRYRKLVDGAHKEYCGRCVIDPLAQRYPEEREMHSQVVVDHDAFRQSFNKMSKADFFSEYMDVFGQTPYSDRRETFDLVVCTKSDCSGCTDVLDDSACDIQLRNDFMKSTTLLSPTSLAEGLTREQYILLPQRVFGYALSSRKWHPLNIDLVRDIKTPKGITPFDRLVLPDTHKELIQALIKDKMGQFGGGDEFFRASRENPLDEAPFELVRGKGRGLIILLHGVPGVGKTSTAECVAEQLQRPLFPITCGDLGTSAETVERRLGEYFTLASKWKSVLLLDEADVFLAKREKGDVHRNSLVSVFLRELEYYSGVLILTTNRVGEFDEGFRSRIHMSLYYNSLDKQSTFAIWNMNLRRMKESMVDMDIEEEKIRKFIERHWKENESRETRRWNGRQIKNAFQMALALANRDYYDNPKEREKLKRPILKAKHFKKVAETSRDFDDYLIDVLGQEEGYSGVAYHQHLRSDMHQKPKSSKTSKASRSKASRHSVYSSPSSDDSADQSDSSTNVESETESDLERKIKMLKKKKKEKAKAQKDSKKAKGRTSPEVSDSN